MIALHLKCHAECRAKGENWAGLSSAAERRKLQNRLNQRAFRRRKAARWSVEQISRGGSVDSASVSTAGTSVQQSNTNSPRVDGPRQEPISFADRTQLECLEPMWEQDVPMDLQADPWILSAPDIWGVMTRDMEQCELSAMSYSCDTKTSEDGPIDRRDNGGLIADQYLTERLSFEDLSSSPWLDTICDQRWLELWLNSTQAPLAAECNDELGSGPL